MERSEPTLFPEWYKGASSSSTGNGSSTGSSSSTGNISLTVGSNSNHHSGSSHSANERTIGFSSRNKFPASVCDQDAPRSFTERTPTSLRRSVSSNGSAESEKDLLSWGYSNFGRSYREKDFNIHDRDRAHFMDNGFFNYPDSLVNNKSEKDPLKRSQSMLSGRNVDSWRKRPGHDSGNDIASGVSTVSGIIKSSFERDFPSLGSDEKHGSDLTRVSSPGMNSVIHNLSVTSSSIIGSDGWSSALAEVPLIARGISSAILPPLSTSAASTNSSHNSTGLNMAEILAQAPVRVRTATQLPKKSQKIEELHRQQILKLRPVTPSMPKGSAISSVDKSKAKGTRITEISSSKVGVQSLSQHAVLVLRPAAKSDASKTSQSGNFQVLNREKNASSPTGKDYPAAANDNSLKLKGTLNLYGEKKPPSQAQNRIDFFNSLRKKTPPSRQTGPSSPNKELGQPFAVVSSAQKLEKMTPDEQHIAAVCEELEKMTPDEEEAAFLRSLGWDENSVEEALTREEIESFLSKYEKLTKTRLLAEE